MSPGGGYREYDPQKEVDRLGKRLHDVVLRTNAVVAINQEMAECLAEAHAFMLIGPAVDPKLMARIEGVLKRWANVRS